MSQLSHLNNLALKRLIYGMTSVVVVDSNTPLDVIKEIEEVRSASTLDGFIFRPAFAATEDLTEYTEEDWSAMFAQYSLTYDWADDYTELTNNDPLQVLQEYFSCQNNDHVEQSPKTASAEASFKVATTDYYRKVAKDIATSKVVLRTHQREIFELLPIDVLLYIFDRESFPIQETRIMFMRRILLEKPGKASVVFSGAKDVLRFVVATYSSPEVPSDTMLTNNVLAKVKLSIPTSMRKRITKYLNDNSSNYILLQEMKANKEFWKRLFQQLKWVSDTHPTFAVKYNKFLTLKNALYTTTIQTTNSTIEERRKSGNLEEAFVYEMRNPGTLLRNILSYLRYPAGTKFAQKVRKDTSTFDLGSVVAGKAAISHTVEKDISQWLNDSSPLMDALQKANPKLLWQVLTLLDMPSLYERRTERRANNTKVRYHSSHPLPGLHKPFADAFKKLVKKAIRSIQRKKNEKLGKVFISKSMKNYPLQFSGREDKGISLSGGYLPTGSKLNLTAITKNMKDPILRVGVAWKGVSCDIDHSLNHKNGDVAYYDPTLSQGTDLLITSSGDITSCSPERFSTELLDIDMAACKKHGYTQMYTALQMYSGPTFDKVEAYWFLDVIERKDRILNSSKVTMSLDAMNYAAKLQDSSRAQIGFYIDLTADDIEIINAPTTTMKFGSNMYNTKEEFLATLGERPKTTSVHKALKNVIAPEQRVKDILDADLIITDECGVPEGIKVLNPAVDMVELQEILF